jgi:hypothetical protein
MATAQLQYRVKPSGGSFGALHEDSIEVSGGDTIRLTAASFAGWATAARWEITAYPPDWPCPSGWSTDASSGHYYYLANTGSSGVAPPDIEIPDEGDYWGKWLFRLTVNGTIVSAKIGVKTLSPALELDDLAFGEGRQFGGNRSHVGDQQTNARKLDEAALVSGSFVASLAATRPIKVDAATGAVTASWEPNAAVNNQGYGFTSCTGVANASGAVAVTAGGGALTMSGSTTASVAASGGGLTLTGSTTAALTATAGALTCTGGTTASLTASSGDLTLGASGVTIVNGAVRLAAQAGVGTRGLVVDASGNVATGSAGASSTAAYWEDASTALNTNGVPTRALAAQLVVENASASAIVPLRINRKGATGSVLDAFELGRTLTSGVGTTGTGVRSAWYLPDGTGAAALAGRLRLELTGVSGANISGKWVASTVNAGTEGDAVTLNADGTVRLHAYSSPGLLATQAGGGVTALTSVPVLTNGAVATIPGSVDITDLSGTLAFQYDAGLPISITRVDGSDGSVLEVLRLSRQVSGAGGAVGLGTAIGIGGYDAGENPVDIGEISAVMTNVGVGTHAARLLFKAADAAALSTLGWWDADGLHVSTDLIVAGTTVTVDSTTVSVADRLVVYNASTGVVPVPAAIAGLVVDRGSADGVTKRDAAGLLWDEANTRWALAYNTTLDQSTIGTYLSLRTGGLLSPSLDNAGGVVTIGASATSLALTPDTTVSGTLTKTGTGLTTTVVPGIVAANTTAATGGATVQNGYAVVSSGAGWETSGGTSKTVRGGLMAQPVSGGSINLAVRIVTDPGTGTLGTTNTGYYTSLVGIGGSGWQSTTFVALSDSGNGYRLITSGGTEYGAFKVNSNSAVLQAHRNQADGRAEAWSNITTGSTDDGARVWNYAGTRSAGNLLAVGDGAAWTQKWAVGYDGRTTTPRVVAAPGTPASAANAVTFNLATSQNVKHTTTEATTVTFSGAVEGMIGYIEFIQGVSGYTVTMPTNGSGVEYSNTIAALTTTGIVDTTPSTRTMLRYYVTGSPNTRVVIDQRAVSTIP